MKSSKEVKLFDKRTYKRYLRKGLITDKDRQSHLASLPDDSKNCEEVPFEDPRALADPTSPPTGQFETPPEQTKN